MFFKLAGSRSLSLCAFFRICHHLSDIICRVLFTHKSSHFCRNIIRVYLLFNISTWHKKETLWTVSVPPYSSPPHNPFLAYFHPRTFQSQFPLVPAARYPSLFLPRSTPTLLFTAIICSVFIVFPVLIDYVCLLLFSLPETVRADKWLHTWAVAYARIAYLSVNVPV